MEASICWTFQKKSPCCQKKVLIYSMLLKLEDRDLAMNRAIRMINFRPITVGYYVANMGWALGWGQQEA